MKFAKYTHVKYHGVHLLHSPVCKTISYDITLSEAHDNGSFGMLPPILTDITITHYNFTNLTSNTSYLIGIIPKYNGLEGNMSSLIVRTKPDQPSSYTNKYVYVCTCKLRYSLTCISILLRMYICIGMYTTYNYGVNTDCTNSRVCIQ